MSGLFSPLREFLKKGDLLLLALCLLASGYGLLLIYSATRYLGGDRNMVVQGAAIAIGVLVYIALTLIDFRTLTDKCWKFILPVSILFILSVLSPLGYSAGGNRNWLQFHTSLPLVQPNEIVKIPFILFMAWLITRVYERERDISAPGSVFLLGGYTALMVGVIAVVCGDFGTCTVYLAIFLTMAWVAGVRLRWFTVPGVLVLCALAVVCIFILPETALWTSNRIMRFRVVFDHALDPLGVGWQQTRAILAIGSGQLTGQGYLQGTQTQAPYSDALPERQNDFIFAVCGEELGLVGCALLLVILALIVARCIWVGRRASSPFSALICMGFAGMVAAQIIFNVGMCLYVLPVMGLTLPFISAGGSSIITLYAAMGIVSSVKAAPMPSWLRDRSQV